MLLATTIGVLAWGACTAQDPATATLDELIARLPAAGLESRFDQDARSLALDPACDELARRLAAGVRMTDDQWRTALLRTKAIRTRETWPEEIPVAISIRVPAWLPVSQITATPRETGWPAARAETFAWERCGNCKRSRQFREAYQELGRLEAGRHEVVFDVTVEQIQGERPRDEKPPPPVSVWNGTLSLAVEIVADRNKAFVPENNRELDDAIWRSLRLGYTTRKVGEESVLTPVLGLAFSDEDAEHFAGIALALEIELWRGDSLLATEIAPPQEEFHLPADSGSRLRRRPVDGIQLEHVPGDALLDSSLLAGFEIRARGIYLKNERNWNAGRWWNGNVRGPLSSIEEQSEAGGR